MTPSADPKRPADALNASFGELYDRATGTEVWDRRKAAQKHARETALRNETPHVGARQRARFARRAAEGRTGLLPAKGATR